MSGPIDTCKAALTIEPQTANKLLLLSALHESESHLHQIEVHAFELQASNILNEAYMLRLKNQLAMQEEKKKNKKKGALYTPPPIPTGLLLDSWTPTGFY